jgi:hypothetical protein
VGLLPEGVEPRAIIAFTFTERDGAELVRVLGVPKRMQS